MTVPVDLDRLLSSRFADELPELGVRWDAAPVDEPELLVLNEALALELGLGPEFLRSPDGLGLLVGTTLPESAVPVAQAYAGHQFGGYVPRLGDGRALLLGELPDGRDLHLKGSGRTPFSRGGDGLAAVGPMLREYLVSEALHALAVPTTRSLAVVATGRPVYREQPLPGAVLSRVAASHLRVGSFQYARATDDRELLRRLADHAIERHHPAAAASPNPYLALFSSVLDVQAVLIARWMLVGFVHGVMNTDNTTISGETIDYGPCAFLDVFDPSAVFSSIDGQGRYSYGNQPIVAQWNLARFAETLIPLVADDDAVAVGLLTTELEAFPARYVAAWSAGMRDKLGLSRSTDRAAVDALIDDLGNRLPAAHTDYSGFFRQLTAVALGENADSLADDETLGVWFRQWRELAPDAESMVRSNPINIPRNHLVEEALDAATTGDLGPFRQLLEVVTDPFTLRPGRERYAAGPPPETPPHITYCGT